MQYRVGFECLVKIDFFSKVGQFRRLDHDLSWTHIIAHVNLDEFAESGRVVVAERLGVAECLENGIGLEQPLLDGRRLAAPVLAQISKITLLLEFLEGSFILW